MGSHATAELLHRLEHHPLPVIDLSLERIRLFMERIGHPERHLPPVVHLAGTNGKGSVLATLQSILQAAGYGVHTYTSPHLVHFNERIGIAGKPITDEALQPLLEQVLEAAQDFPLTFFESTTAAAFLAFQKFPADIVLLETGLGGRLDATNLVAEPVLTIITPVSYDHMEYLGSTLTAIAREKGGIMKPGVTSVLGPQEAEAADALEQVAAAIHAPLSRAGLEWRVEAEAGRGFSYHEAAFSLTGLTPGLNGTHQYANAGTAIAAARALPGFSIPEEALRRGVAEAVWPARLQRLKAGPLVEALPKNTQLWLDGGHNPAAASILAGWCVAEGKHPALIYGMMQDKDREGFLRPLVGQVGEICTVPVPGAPRAASPESLAETARSLGFEAAPFVSVQAAAQHLAAHKNPPEDILIAGSLYLAGHVLEKNA